MYVIVGVPESAAAQHKRLFGRAGLLSLAHMLCGLQYILCRTLIDPTQTLSQA